MGSRPVYRLDELEEVKSRSVWSAVTRHRFALDSTCRGGLSVILCL